MAQEVKLRVTVMGLFTRGNTVLVIDKRTEPEANKWDIPGGKFEPNESMAEGLRREVREETGITSFEIGRLLTVSEEFLPRKDKLLHSVSIIYKCKVQGDPPLRPTGPDEVGPRGVCWMPLSELKQEECTVRSWRAFMAAGLVK